MREQDKQELPEIISIAQSVYAARWVIAILSLAISAIAALIVFTLPDIYRSSALVALNTENVASGFSSVPNYAGSGLAGLANLALGSTTDDRSMMGLAVLQSKYFIKKFISSREILPQLMALAEWDFDTGQPIYNPDIYDERASKWVRKVRKPLTPVPSPDEAYEAFSKIIHIKQSKDTGFIEIAVENQSPIYAKQWIDWLITDLNEEMRQREIDRANKAIDFLEQQSQSTPLAELRQVFFNLIEDQTKKVMLASISEEYLFLTIDPAVVSLEKSRPARLLLIFLTLLVSILLLTFAVSLHGVYGGYFSSS